jgi:hypothetical protein
MDPFIIAGTSGRCRAVLNCLSADQFASLRSPAEMLLDQCRTVALERYTLEKQAQRHLELYQDLLSNRS